MSTSTATPLRRRGVSAHRRLLPLHVAVGLQGFMLWLPVEKLFMSEIGFTAATVGVMAAAYAAVVPLVEVPSGVLADRWSRRGVLMMSSVALGSCALVGGLSRDVATYVVSALLMGVFFALRSGTLDAVVYDTVVEETGAGDDFERSLGRVRVTESIALVAGSLVGAGVASLTSTRLTYFLTVPFALLSVVAYGRFAEPRLHRMGERSSLGDHLALTYRTLARSAHLRPVITLTLLYSVTLQLVLEFGPLWLVALAAPSLMFGPYWAGLMSTFGIGGALAGRVRLDQPSTGAAVAVAMVSASAVLALTSHLGVVIIAQVVLSTLVVVASVHASRVLHDAVPSQIRSGVASGVGTLSWIVFLPIALAFGVASAGLGVHAGGWMLTAVTAVAAGLLLRRPPVDRREPLHRASTAPAEQALPPFSRPEPRDWSR